MSARALPERASRWAPPARGLTWHGNLDPVTRKYVTPVHRVVNAGLVNLTNFSLIAKILILPACEIGVFSSHIGATGPHDSLALEAEPGSPMRW